MPKLDRVDPIDHRPSTNKDGGPKQLCYALYSLGIKPGRILHLQGLKVSFLIGMDTTFTRMGSVLAKRARHYIY